MTPRPQEVGALVALALVVCVLVLVCLGALLGGRASPSQDDDTGHADGTDGSAGLEASGHDDPRVTSYSSDRNPGEEAAEILRSYEEQGSCVLREAGFIDLFGNAWTCTVQGPGWVDVCLVSGLEGDGDGRESEVRVVRMEVGEWERAYGRAVG